MKTRRFGAMVSLVAMLAACSGGGSGSVNPGGGGGGSTPTPTADACSLANRKAWAKQQMDEWYLFPETLPAALDPAPYASVDDYIDALTATARAQGRDRYFTYLASIAEENAYYNAGASAGFGFRLSTDVAARRVFVMESFEGAAALAAGIDRGTEILAIGTSAGTLHEVSGIIAAEGAAGVTNALGPTTAGTTRVMRVNIGGTVQTVTLVKSDYALTPVSSRYGAQIITDPVSGGQVGYVNLRTFIDTADPALRSAFAQFRAAGVTEIIVDLRYNGGGLMSITELMGDLMGGNRSASDVFSYMTFRASKSTQNKINYFTSLPQSIAPTRIAFIGTAASASASEVIVNSMIPYLKANVALIGTNTYGKPVGQIGLDRAACDDRLRVIAFATDNRDHQGGYFNGLLSVVQASCQAADQLAYPMGDPREASTRTALDFLAGRSCTAISSGGQGTLALQAGKLELLSPERPSTAQREVPGLF